MAVIEPWEYGCMDFNPDSDEYEDSRGGRLMYECLRLSPSYNYADLFKRGMNRYIDYVPDDNEHVINVYNEISGLNRSKSQLPFVYWWKFIGRYIFDKLPKDNSRVIEIFRTKNRTEDTNNECIDSLDRYLKGEHSDNGYPSIMLLSVPLVGSKRNILNSLNKLIGDTEILKPKSATSFKLFQKRIHEEALKKKLRLLWLSALQPNKLIYLCLESGFSKEYANENEYAKALREKTPEEIDKMDNAIKATTSRALYDMVYIIENAARGRFPCSDKTYLPNIDKKKVLKLIQADIREKSYYYKKHNERKLGFKNEPVNDENQLSHSNLE